MRVCRRSLIGAALVAIMGAVSVVQAWPVEAPGRGAPAESVAPGCSLRSLPGLATLLSRVPAEDRSPAAAGGGLTVRPSWLVFERAAFALVDAARVSEGPIDLGTLRADDPRDRRLPVPCTPSLVANDFIVYKLARVGYSTTEIVAIVRAERSRTPAGGTRARVASAPTRTEWPAFPAANYASPGLDARPSGDATWPAPTYKPVTASITPATAPAQAAVFPRTAGPQRPPAVQVPVTIDAHVRSLAAVYQVDPRLVSAMIRQESNWQPTSVSAKGAIGLMQLMPATASMLGVDPRDPVDNLRGGIAYFADLLREFGNVRDALTAYNAGPEHAWQVVRGERRVFPETRRYLDAIATAYPFAR